MGNLGKIIRFAVEMVKQRPSKSMLKIYIYGSTLALLGAVGGVVEKIYLALVERGGPGDDEEDDLPELLTVNQKKKEQEVLRSHHALIHAEVVEVQQTEVDVSKVKQLMAVRWRSSANRLHAS